MRYGLAARALTALAGIMALSGVSTAKEDSPCKMAKLASLPVTVMADNTILLDGSIKGVPGHFMVDTGDDVTLFDNAVLSQFGLHPTPRQSYAYGMGGRFELYLTQIPNVQIGNFKEADLMNWVSSTHFLPNGTYASLGEDFFSNFDIDIDLASQQFNLFERYSCATEPVYWAKVFSQADIVLRGGHIEVSIEVNGTPTRAWLDTGSPRSSVSWTFARRIGLAPDSPGMQQVGTTHGIDRREVQEYSYRFAELRVGDEVIKNPQLRVLELMHYEHDSSSGYKLQGTSTTDIDAIIGADFIRSHHIYVAADKRAMYFTWNGGHIFLPPSENTPAAAVAH